MGTTDAMNSCEIAKQTKTNSEFFDSMITNND